MNPLRTPEAASALLLYQIETRLVIDQLLVSCPDHPQVARLPDKTLDPAFTLLLL
jgi:hypothetical protein